jgi:2-polyprenyl-6-hydroxyphenyl methylase/3-demethylubiquinone-9 3-methyltransferase
MTHAAAAPGARRERAPGTVPGRRRAATSIHGDAGLPAWHALFRTTYLDALRPGAEVLDVGSGRRPTIAPEVRPEGTRYVGLDISASELAAAPEGSYDESHVADVETLVPALEGRFDLIVSWQVLEHVRDMAATLRALRRYLRPGGLMVLEFTGKWSIPGVFGRVLPRSIGRWGLIHLTERSPSSIFPAYFDRCSARELRPLLGGMHDVRIVPRYAGAGYFRWFPLMHRVAARLTESMERGRHENLAAYYLVTARR